MKSIYKTCIDGELDELKKRRNEINEIIEELPKNGDDLREDEDDISFAIAFCKDICAFLEDSSAVFDMSSNASATSFIVSLGSFAMG